MEPVPAAEELAEWVKQIVAMTPQLPQTVKSGYHLFEETLESGERLVSVFNDQLYCRYVPIKLPLPFTQVQPIINHLMPPYVADDIVSIHLPPFGVVACKIYS